MGSQLLARVDGLTVRLLDRERVWPVTTGASARRPQAALSARERARIERQTAVVREARVPDWIDALADYEAQQERLEIRAELARAGLL